VPVSGWSPESLDPKAQVRHDGQRGGSQPLTPSQSPSPTGCRRRPTDHETATYTINRTTQLEPAIRRSVCPSRLREAVSRTSRPDGFFGTEHVTEKPTGAVTYIHGAALSWLIERRSVDGVCRPATVGFFLVAAGRAACHFVDCLAEAGCLAGGPGKRD
jgi:hypothetical protein